jgi:hypothetical protein
MPEPHLHKLLTLLGVERVLVIDDDFAPPASTYTLAFDPGHGPKVEGLPELPDGGDYEDHVQRHWDAVPIAEKVKVLVAALKVEGFVDPRGDPTGLRDLVEPCYFRGMTLYEWQRLSEKLLADKRRALVLFDVNFGRETGDSDDTAGLVPAGEVLNGGYDHIVGLLTTKVAAGDEESAAQGWAPDAHVDRSRLVVVNKNLLGDPDNSGDISEVVEQIRRTLQASQILRLREKVRASLEGGLARAAEMIGERSSTMLEDLVFRASREGGEWEGDTWFRLYGTLGLAHARRVVAVDKSTRRAIEDVRNLLHERTDGAREESAVLAAEVERAEAYEGSDYVNEAGLPIANGDIFKIKAGPAYILVGQPCDLMLRPDGRARDPRTATLLPIKPRSEVIERGEISSYQLPLGSPLGDGEWEVRFRPGHHVLFDVLDLVSFNTEGRATTRPKKGTALTPLLPGLQARSDAIEKNVAEATKLLEVIETLVQSESITSAVANKLRHSVLAAGGPIKATLIGTPTPFAFDCVRIGRLAGSYADALRAAYSAAQSRIAHEHELTRIVT